MSKYFTTTYSSLSLSKKIIYNVLILPVCIQSTFKDVRLVTCTMRIAQLHLNKQQQIWVGIYVH